MKASQVLFVDEDVVKPGSSITLDSSVWKVNEKRFLDLTGSYFLDRPAGDFCGKHNTPSVESFIKIIVDNVHSIRWESK